MSLLKGLLDRLQPHVVFNECCVQVDSIELNINMADCSKCCPFGQTRSYRSVDRDISQHQMACFHMSRLMGKPTICIGENKDADQLRGNREADQRLCFRYTDSTIPLLSKSKVSSF